MKLIDIDVSNFDTIFLDRDGVINKLLPGDYVKSWNEFSFIDGVLDALSLWKRQHKRVIIVTNQRGVGKGLMSLESLDYIHKKMINAIKKNGGNIDKIYYCTATSDNNINRKPNIGMFVRALKDFPDIKKSTTMMIGDSDSDELFAVRCGIKFIKV
jgi:histidinol-phosphate phosphatase family protein